MEKPPQFLLWPEAFEVGAARCGGKGWNLSRLHRYGFKVPIGGVLTAEGYIHILRSTPIADLLQDLSRVSAEEAVKPDVMAALDLLRHNIESAEWPPLFAKELDEFLRKLGCEHARMAVRSSATAEDASNASFAGMHRSFLNVKGTASIASAILSCYASLWTPRALAYRRRMGFKDAEICCAVVLCAMVTHERGGEPESAGVAFTCDPVTGQRGLIVINAAQGGCENVVSGAARPEQTVVRREKRGMFVIDHRSDAVTTVLSTAHAIQLARVACRVQWALGDGQEPQDIEWAFDGNRFWLLQARPVTSVPTFTFPQIKNHALYWSTANIKEAFPGVISTMSWSLIQNAVNDVLYVGFIAAGYKIPHGLEVVRRFDGRGYFDLTAMQWCLYDAFGFMPAETVMAIGGHQPEISLPPGNPLRGKAGRRRALARLRLAKRLWRLDRELQCAISKRFQRTKNLIPADLKTIPMAELLRTLEQIEGMFDDIGVLAGLANAGAGSWQNLLKSQLRSIAGDRSHALMNRLLAGSGNVTSAEQGYRIHDLAAVALTDESALKWLQARGPAAEWVALPSDSPFRMMLERFLDEFGHRAVYEADLMNPRWNEDPSYILEQVRHCLKEGIGESSARKARALRAQAENEVCRMTFWRRPLIRWLVTRLQQGMALREAAKSAMGATAPSSRQALLEVGRRLVMAGSLNQAPEIFHLSAHEVQDYLLGEWDGLGAGMLAADRKAQRERWLTLSPPDVIIVRGPGVERRDVIQHARRVSPNRWSGLGVAPGQAQGMCRIVRHPLESDDLKRGEILVAPSTDPGWTPLFLRAAGIVMETGGYLSHGAIVAREYGLPAVVNIPGLLEEVQNGMKLVVDGDGGTVEAME